MYLFICYLLHKTLFKPDFEFNIWLHGSLDARGRGSASFSKKKKLDAANIFLGIDAANTIMCDTPMQNCRNTGPL